jgi:hypothetical protein
MYNSTIDQEEQEAVAREYLEQEGAVFAEAFLRRMQEISQIPDEHNFVYMNLDGEDHYDETGDIHDIWTDSQFDFTNIQNFVMEKLGEEDDETTVLTCDYVIGYIMDTFEQLGFETWPEADKRFEISVAWQDENRINEILEKW